MEECQYALRVAGPAKTQIEISIDGAPYRPCRHDDGQWWYRWGGALSDNHHMVVVIRSVKEE